MFNRSRFMSVLVILVLTILFVIVAYQFVRSEHKPVVLVSTDALSLEENNGVTAFSKRINLPDFDDGHVGKTTKALAFLKRPTHRLTGKLIDHLDTLQNQYSNGDKAAGYTLAANLLRCDRAAVTKEQVERQIQTAIENDERPGFVEQAVKKFEFCEGVPAQTRSQHLMIFSELAESGFTPALEVMSSIPAKMYMQFSQQDELPRDEYIGIRDEFEATKYRYLHQAASKGSLLALHKLSGLNTHRLDMIARDHTSVSLSLASVAVLLHFTKDNVSHSRGVFQQNRLNNMASPEELFNAQQRASVLINKIEKIGEVYPAMENEKWAYTFY